MKICMLTYRGNPFSGGQGVYVSNLAEALSALGHEVHCVSGPPYLLPMKGVTCHRVPGLLLFGENGGYPPPDRPLSAFTPLNFFEKAAFHAGIFPEMTTFSLRAFRAVRTLLRRHRFDVIHDNQTLGWGLLPLKLLGVPLVATIHHPLTVDRLRGFEPPTTFGKQFHRTIFFPVGMQGVVARRVAHVITVSEASAREIESQFRIPPERITVVYNGVDAEKFRPQRGSKPVPGRILFVGNIEDPNKGGIFLLRALAQLPPPAHLVISTGGVSDRPAFDDLLRQLGVAERVTLHTRMAGEPLVRLFATAEVAVSPSIFEGFGFPAVEAMACGVPLVAADGGALPEVVGKAAIVVPARDPGALATALGEVLASPALRKKLALAGRRRVIKRFRWDTAAVQVADVYRKVISAHR